jgi:PleD family two-component response regulator
VGERVRAAVSSRAPGSEEGEDAGLTISLGVCGTGGDYDYPRLLRGADDALYRAKHHGRNYVSD